MLKCLSLFFFFKGRQLIVVYMIINTQISCNNLLKKKPKKQGILFAEMQIFKAAVRQLRVGSYHLENLLRLSEELSIHI